MSERDLLSELEAHAKALARTVDPPGIGSDPLHYLTGQAAAEIKTLRAYVAELEATLKECTDDLACEIEARYDRIKNHPAMKPKYERDIVTVVHARAVLTKGPSTSAQDEGAA